MRSISTHSQGRVYRRQSGVALAILVWFLAGMSILVAAIVYQARIDIKLAQLQIGQAEAQAAGDGAIHLAMAELIILEQEGEFDGHGIHSSEVLVGDLSVTVRIVPVTGLVDLNLASEELLGLLFADSVELGDGQVLARNVVEWRSSEDGNSAGTAGWNELGASPRQGRFEAIEDLLLVPGVNRDIFEHIKESVYVAEQGQAGVDWRSAPVSVLAVLNSGDEESALALAQSRVLDSQGDASIPSGMNMLFQEEQPLPIFRVDALVNVDGMNYQRRRWVDRGQSGADGLPWRFFRTEPVTVL